MESENLFNRPVVVVSGNTVKRYYTSINATLQDGFDPYKVALVCVHGQKTHKGKVFRFASEMDIVAYEILKDLNKEEVVKNEI